MTTREAWDPGQYERFAAERRRPFLDLLALCQPVPGGSIVDLGCGPGDLTVELHRALGAARTTGIELSAAMLEQARLRHGAVEGVSFEKGDLAAWRGPPVDLVAASASLHWAPQHRALLSRLREGIRPGGQLAFQVPANFSHVSHALAKVVAAEEPFAAALGDDAPSDRGDEVLAPEAYAEILYSLGASEQVARLEVYGHRLDSSAEVVEWVLGTLLTPYRSRLDEATFARFVDRYRERLLAELGDVRPYFYPFRRILCWARFDA
jgi:trans-aconitate 2-methyltransferase